MNVLIENKDNELEQIAFGEGTDKSKRKHFYTKWYNFYFNSIRHKKLNLLEIGVNKGYSLFVWGKYFENANIYGIDNRTEDMSKEVFEKFTIFIGDQSNKQFLEKVCESIPGGLDIVIDDGSHMSKHQIASFVTLFPKLNPGAIYIIEDLFLSYNEDFQSIENFTIMDFLKKRIDDVNFSGKYKWCNFDIIKEKERTQEKVRDRRKPHGSTRVSLKEYEKMIESMHFYNGICFIFKRHD